MTVKRLVFVIVCIASLAGCGKVGFSGSMDQLVGDWAELKLPPGCVPQQIAAEHNAGVAVLCKDGRIFH